MLCLQNGALNEEGRVRHRAPHHKSTAGCGTCKARHLRCDEAKPFCKRCEKAGRECAGYEDKQLQRRFQFKAFRPVTFDSKPLTPFYRPDTFSPVESNALQYFSSFTLSSLGRFSYPALWSGSTLHLIFNTPALRHVALAVGSRHMELSEKPSVASAADAPPDLADGYSRAVRSLREAASSPAADATVVALASLLFVLYESLGKRRSGFAMHLANGIRVASENSTTVDKSDIGHELRMTLLRLGLNSLLLMPNLSVFAAVTDARTHLAQPQSLNTLDQIRGEVDNISSAVYGFLDKIFWARFPDSSSAHQAAEVLEKRLERLDRLLEEFDGHHPALSALDSSLRRIVEARSVVAKVFLRGCTTRYQTTYDRFFPLYRKIVALMTEALSIMRENSGDDRGRLPSFSLDLGIISTLFHTVGVCRHPVIRRQALALLKLCPKRDGAWDADDTWKVAKTRMELEEQLADNYDENGQVVCVPEECRIHFTKFVYPKDDSGSRMVRFQWKPVGSSEESAFKYIYLDEEPT